jgi:endogenous inhibitor of DNA gyrase (YacG/DUF329 family)
MGSASSQFDCRVCGKAIDEALTTFPFCSERCRLLDLGGWLDGSYRISRVLSPSEEAAIERGGAPQRPLEADDGG